MRRAMCLSRGFDRCFCAGVRFSQGAMGYVGIALARGGVVCVWAGRGPRGGERGGEERDGGEPVASGEKCRQEGVGGAVARAEAVRGRTKLVVARPAWVILVAKTTVSGIVDWVGRTSIPYGDLP